MEDYNKENMSPLKKVRFQEKSCSVSFCENKVQIISVCENDHCMCMNCYIECLVHDNFYCPLCRKEMIVCDALSSLCESHQVRKQLDNIEGIGYMFANSSLFHFRATATPPIPPQTTEISTIEEGEIVESASQTPIASRTRSRIIAAEESITQDSTPMSQFGSPVPPSYSPIAAVNITDALNAVERGVVRRLEPVFNTYWEQLARSQCCRVCMEFLTDDNNSDDRTMCRTCQRLART